MSAFPNMLDSQSTMRADALSSAAMRPYGIVLAVYVFASWLTRPVFQGDTLDYVGSIVAHVRGGTLEFWEFGHLLWRPLGYVAFRMFSPILSLLVGPDITTQVALGLTLISWLVGLIGALFLLALLRLYSDRTWISLAVVTAFIFSTAELNYSRSGTPYVPGLAFLIVAMYLIARDATGRDQNIALEIGAGIALALAVLLWFPFSLATPAALLLPFASVHPDAIRLRRCFTTGTSLSVALGVVYVSVLAHLGIFTVAGVLAWFRESSHGITIGGVPRAIFGWARSFMNMGDAGRIIKRYLLHDPFNPIPRRELLSLWPEILTLAIFYATILALVAGLIRFPRGRRLLSVAILAALPMLAFAIHWSGGDLERYLPLYPFFFLLLFVSLCDARSVRWTRAMLWIFVVALVLTNAAGLRSAVVQSTETQTESRVRDLLPRLKPGSLIFVSHNLDELTEFERNFPFNPVNRARTLNVYPLLTPGNSDIREWREAFASRTLRVWQSGGDVWVSNRLFRSAPRAEWNWVEGDDRRVSWSELHPFFSHLQYGETVGGDDGFILVSPSAENQALLRPLNIVAPRQAAPPTMTSSLRAN